MNITLIAPNFPPQFDGVGDHAYALAHALSDAGYRVHVLTAGTHGPQRRFRVTSVGETWNASATIRACRLIAQSHEDLVLMEYTPFLFGVGSPAPIILAWYTRMMRIPCVAIAHEIFHDAASAALRPLGQQYFAMRDALVLSGASRIAAPSEQRRARILSRMPWLAKKIELIPIAANCEPDASYAPHPPDGGPFDIIAFGIVMPRRRFELAIDALARTRQSIDARLIIIGRIADEAYAARCRTYAQAQGVGDSVVFTGSVDSSEISEHFSHAHAAIFTAREGCTGSSGSLLALLAHSVPIVAARTDFDDPRFAEVVALSEPNPAALSEQLLSISAAPARARAMAARGANFYRSDFDWNAVGRGLVNGSAGGAHASVALA